MTLKIKWEWAWTLAWVVIGLLPTALIISSNEIWFALIYGFIGFMIFFGWNITKKWVATT